MRPATSLCRPLTGRETWGLVANEMAARLAGAQSLFQTLFGCAPDLATNGAAGRMFPLGNYRALAEAIAAVPR